MGKYKSKFNGQQIDDGIEYGVRVTQQTFSSEQKQQARGNIAAQETLVVGTNLDDTPTANSTHPVTSGGVKNYVDNMTGDRDIADADGLYSQGKLTLEKNIVNGVNILTQSMFYNEDTENPGEYIPKFTDTEVVIKYDFYINEDSFDLVSTDKFITLPAGTVLKFEGGCIHIAEENGSRPFYYINAGLGKKCSIVEDGHMILDYVPVGSRLTNDYINASSIGVSTANKTDNAARINRFFRYRGGGLRLDEPCMWVGSAATPDASCYSIEMPIRMPYNGGKITGIGCIADVGSILVPTSDFLTNYPNRGVIETVNYWKGLTTAADEEMEANAAYAYAHGIEISNLQVRCVDRADFGIVIWCCGEDAKIERLHVSTSNKAAIFFGGLSAVARARLCFVSNSNSAGSGYLYDNHPDANFAPGISAALGGRGSGGSASLVECSGDCYNWVKANGSLALDIVAPKIEFCANAIVSEHTGTGNVAQQINMTGGRIQFTQGDKYILKAYSAAACHCTIQNMTAYAHAKTAYYTSTSTSVAKMRDDTIGFWSNDAAFCNVFGASGTNHSKGLVPDPGATAGMTKFLREDGTWQVINVDVSGKADKDTDAVEGNLAEFDGNGNPVDSGISAGNVAEKDGEYQTLTAGNIVGTFSEEKQFVYRQTAGIVDVASSNAYKAGQGAKIKSIRGRMAHWNQLYNDSVPTALSGHTYYLRENVGGTINESISTTISYTNGSTERMCVDISLFYSADTLRVYASAQPSRTVAEFKADFFRLFGRPIGYEPYTEDTLVFCKMATFRTIGFNQWDEQWENGSYNAQTGQKDSGDTTLRCKNKIRVLPNTVYYMKVPNTCRVGFFSGDTFISSEVVTNTTFTTPDNCTHVVFHVSSTPTYASNICLNISHSGTRNGEYEPYWESVKDIPVTELKGKLNGEGESVTVFPDGMKHIPGGRTDYSANILPAFYDEIVSVGGKTLAYKRVKNIKPVSQSTWSKSGDVFLCQGYGSSSAIATSPRLVIDGYLTSTSLSGTILSSSMDMSCGGGQGTKVLYFKNTGYSGTANNFRALMATMDIYTQMPTEEVYVLDDFELPVDYDVDDWGTEEVTGGDVAPWLGLEYGINAPDTIRNLYKNFVSATESQNFTDTQKKRVLDNLGISNGVTALADATDEASAIALVNQIKSVLVDSGILKSGS